MELPPGAYDATKHLALRCGTASSPEIGFGEERSVFLEQPLHWEGWAFRHSSV